MLGTCKESPNKCWLNLIFPRQFSLGKYFMHWRGFNFLQSHAA